MKKPKYVKYTTIFGEVTLINTYFKDKTYILQQIFQDNLIGGK